GAAGFVHRFASRSAAPSPDLPLTTGCVDGAPQAGAAKRPEQDTRSPAEETNARDTLPDDSGRQGRGGDAPLHIAVSRRRDRGNPALRAGRPGAEGTVHLAQFRLAGQRVKCIDSPIGHAFDFTPSFSFFIDCDREEELDRLVAALGEG